MSQPPEGFTAGSGHSGEASPPQPASHNPWQPPQMPVTPPGEVTNQSPAAQPAQPSQPVESSTDSFSPALAPTTQPVSFGAPPQPPNDQVTHDTIPLTPDMLPPSDPSVSTHSGSTRRLGLAKTLLAAVTVLVLGLAAGFVGGWFSGQRDPGITVVSGGAGGTTRPAGSVADVAARVLPSVVAIETKAYNSGGTGSGFILRSDGHILTNNHVIENVASGGSLTVIFSDGERKPATIIGRTPAYDLAVIKVEGKDLPALPMGDSSQVVVGDPVIAFGAPLGLQGTVTTGIVSSLNRPVAAGQGKGSAFINAIQTDAAINPGNSGGPLVDMAGNVIGINSAIARDPSGLSEGSIGVGFSIPASQATRSAQQLIKDGFATYPVVGVLLDQNYDGQGVRIAQSANAGRAVITPNSPADRAGLKPGDVIMSFNGRPLTAPDELIVAIRASEVGQKVTLKVKSGDDERDVDMVLDSSERDD